MPNQPLKPDKVDMSVNLGGLQMKIRFVRLPVPSDTVAST